MRWSLFWRRTETKEGGRIVSDAWALSCLPQYRHLSDAELIRLAYWGASGEEDLAGRPRHD